MRKILNNKSNYLRNILINLNHNKIIIKDNNRLKGYNLHYKTKRMCN